MSTHSFTLPKQGGAFLSRFLQVFGAALILFVLGAIFAEAAYANDKFLKQASGSSSWTIYAFGNAQAVSDSLRAVANFVNSSMFKNLVSMLAIVGVLIVGVTSGFHQGMGRKFIGYIVFVFLVVYLLFGVARNGDYRGALMVHVDIEDVVDGTWKSTIDLPAVVGIPASLISRAGHELTRQVEASFMLPTEMKMSEGAPFNLAATLISDMSKAKIQDADLANSLAYYVQDCFMIGAARGELDASSLLSSTDFLTDIRVPYKSVYVNTSLGDPKGVPKLVSCEAAHSHIVAAVNSQGSDVASFLTNASAWHSTPALSVINSAADSVASWAVSGANASGGAMVKQAAVLAAFQPAFNKAASATGNSDFLTALAVNQASTTQKNGWIVGAEVFNRVMGYIFAVLQVFVYAITPLILAAAIIPSLGISLLKNFSQVLLWLAIWQPMLAIVNFIVISMQRASIGGALATSSDTYGFTMSNLAIVSERTANMGAAATFIGTMVPMLAWAFVKGSVDFSRLLGSAIGENLAQQGGSTLTTGNFSFNQGSLDSFTANKTSISALGDFGNGYTSNSTDRTDARFNQGGATMMAGGMPISAALSSQVAVSETAQTNQGYQGSSGGSKMDASTSGMQVGNSWGMTHGGNQATTLLTGNAAGGTAAANLKLPTGTGQRSQMNTLNAANPNASSNSVAHPSQLGTATMTPPPNPSVFSKIYSGGAAAVSAVNPTVGGQLQASTNKQNLDSTQVGANQGTTGQENSGASSTVQGIESDIMSHGAGTSQAASDQRVMNISAPVSAYDRAQLMIAASHGYGSGYGRYNPIYAAMGMNQDVDASDPYYQRTLGDNNPVAQRYMEMTSPEGGVAQQYTARLEEVKHAMDSGSDRAEQARRAGGPSRRLLEDLSIIQNRTEGAIGQLNVNSNISLVETIKDKVPFVELGTAPVKIEPFKPSN